MLTRMLQFGLSVYSPASVVITGFTDANGATPPDVVLPATMTAPTVPNGCWTFNFESSAGPYNVSFDMTSNDGAVKSMQVETYAIAFFTTPVSGPPIPPPAYVIGLPPVYNVGA